MSIILYLFFSFAFLSLINAKNIHHVQCPCFGIVSVPKAQAKHESYDVIIHRIHHTAGTFVDTRLCRRNIILKEFKSSRTDAMFYHLHEFSIPAHGAYSITVVPSIKSGVPPPNTIISLKSTVRQQSCPDLIARQSGSIRMLRNSIGKETDSYVNRGMFIQQNRQFNIDTPDENFDKRFINSVDPPLLPYMAAIISTDPNNKQTICSGVLLSEKWVITAANCKAHLESKVFVGVSQALVDGVEMKIKNVFNNPRYRPDGRGAFWDIALIELEKSVTTEFGFSSFMKVNFNPSFPADNSVVRVAGFGVNRFITKFPNSFPNKLAQVDLPVVSNRRCKLVYRRATNLLVSKRWQFCAGYLENACESCGENTGGAVFQLDGEQPVLLGLVTSDAGCSSPNLPRINARLSAFKSFLLSTGAVFTEHKTILPQVMVRCPPGTFLFSLGRNAATCTPCPKSGFSPGGLARVCMLCPPGTQQDPNNGAKCT